MEKKSGRIWRGIPAAMLAAVMVLALPAVLPAQSAVGVSADTIKIGVISDLTGPSAIGGIGMADAIRSYFNDLNEKGGINGRKVQVIVEDSKYSPTLTVAAAKKLISKDEIFALVSPWGSGPSEALFPLAQEQKIPVAPACALSTTMYEPLKKMVFAVGTNYIDQSLFFADYVIHELKIKKPKVALFCQDDDWGRDHLKGLEIAAQKYGLEKPVMESYKYDAVEFKSQVINLMRAKPDAVLVAASLRSGASFLSEAAKLKWNPVSVGGNTLGFFRTLEMAGQFGEGLRIINIFAMPDEDLPGVKRMVEVSKKNFGDKWMPANEKLHPYYVYGWINSIVFAEGAKRAGKNLTREGLVQAMETLKDFDPEGLMGPISYTSTSHGSPGYARMTQADVKNKRFVPLTGWKAINR
jgi:branched-chain amino acid transport system substrate-binding protein